MYEESLRGPIIYIRHAQSKYNQIMLDPNNIHLKNSFDLIDCGITEEGKLQSENLGKVLTECKIRTVFISPLNRTIETCFESLKNHKDFEMIKFIILPLASEIIDSSCDIPLTIEEKKVRFNSYDKFNLDWDLCKDYYFLNNIDDANFKEILKDVNYSNYEQNYSLYEKGLNICFSNKKSGESLKNLYKRSLELKSFLKDFLSRYGIAEDEKILVYTHSAITRISTSYLAHNLEDIPFYPEDSHHLNNCEFLTINTDYDNFH